MHIVLEIEDHNKCLNQNLHKIHHSNFFLSYGCEICLISRKTRQEEDSLLQENLKSWRIKTKRFSVIKSQPLTVRYKIRTSNNQ